MIKTYSTGFPPPEETPDSAQVNLRGIPLTVVGTVDVDGLLTVATQAPGNNTTRVATTAFVTAAVAASTPSAAAILAALLTVDGTGSGLDADLLDGLSSAAFATASHTHAQADVTGLVAALASLAPLASPTLTGTPLVPTATAGTNTQQAASTAFVAAALASAVTGLLEFKGSTNASANPNYPAADKGDSYAISVAGKIGGASGKSVDVGDMVIATADNAGGTEASVGTSWTVLEHNLTGALLSANNLSDLANVATARTNLGLGTAATQSTATFCQVANNLSDVTAPAARTNLAVPGLAVANTFSTGGQVIAGNSDIVQLSVNAHSTQSAGNYIFQCKSSNGAVSFRVKNFGAVDFCNGQCSVDTSGNFSGVQMSSGTKMYLDGPNNMFGMCSGVVAKWNEQATSYFGGAGTYVGDSGIGRNAAGVLEVNNGTLGTFRDLIARNHLVNSTGSLGGGVGVIGLANATTNPSTNPTGGCVIYADSGAAKVRGSSGTTTTFGPADPHCPQCGRDFVMEWQNEKYGYLAVCMWCLVNDMPGGKKPYVVTRSGSETKP